MDHVAVGIANDELVVKFYKNRLRVSDCDKDIEEWINEATNREWEDCHNYIQWLFPTTESSGHAPQAFLLAEYWFSFREDAVLKARMARALHRFLTFLGLDSTLHGIAGRWPYVDRDKFTPKNHNRRRISRALRSTRLMCLTVESCNFLRNLLTHVHEGAISADAATLREWKDACLGIHGESRWARASNAACVDECARIISMEDQTSAASPPAQQP